MMQIDCEVTNTQLLHLQQSVIPAHLRNISSNNKSTSQSNRFHSDLKDIANPFVANITRNYKPYFIKKEGGNQKPLFRKNFKTVFENRSSGDYSNKGAAYVYKEKYVPEVKSNCSTDGSI